VLPAGNAPHPLPTPLDGGHEWIAADGSFHVDARARVTLGRADSPAAGLLRRRGELAVLRERLAALEAEHRRLAGEEAALAEAVAALETQQREQERRAAELGLARKAVEQELAHARREIERLEQVREAVQRETAQFEAELERNRAQQAELAGELERWQETRTRLEGAMAGLREQVERARAALQAVAEQLMTRKLERERQAVRLEALRQRLAESDAARAEAAAKLEETEASLAGQEGKQAATAAAIAALDEGLKARHGELETLRGVERERRQAFEALGERHRALDARAKESQRRHEAHQARIHDVELKFTAERMRLEQHAAQLAELPPREEPDETQDSAEPAQPAQPSDERALERRLNEVQARLQRMEGVNLAAPEEYEALAERLIFLRSQQDDLDAAIADLEASIRRMNAESRRRFRETFDLVNEKFQALFPQVFGGGEARLVLTESEDPLLAGVDIEAQPPGKKLQTLNLLSGGEKALTAISLIFSFFLHKPSPFCLLDEVDAPLDDVNVTRFNRLIQSMTDHSQFIIITHNKRTMEVADRLFGVTMEDAGVSKIVSVDLSGAA
jgi:chromosome segregation protein